MFYNIPAAVRLTGELDEDALEQDVQRDHAAPRGVEDEVRNNRRQACAGDLGSGRIKSK